MYTIQSLGVDEPGSSPQILQIDEHVESLPSFTSEELSQHKKIGDLWISINGKVYDVTGWPKNHPGGELPVLHLAGQDVTDAFLAFHLGTAWSFFPQFLVGMLSDSDVPPCGEGAQTATSGVQESRTVQESTGRLHFVRMLGSSVACAFSAWSLVLKELHGSHAEYSHVRCCVESERLAGGARDRPLRDDQKPQFRQVVCDSGRRLPVRYQHGMWEEEPQCSPHCLQQHRI